MFVIFIVEFVSERDRVPPIVSPPLNVLEVLVVEPRPVTVDSVSDSEVSVPLVDLTVIVEPDEVIVVPPEPEIVTPPARVLTLVTRAVVSRLIMGVCPVDISIPVPLVAP